MAPEEPIDQLIERSSFGTPTVRSLANRTPDEVARRIVDRVCDRQRPEDVPDPQAPVAVVDGQTRLQAALTVWQEQLAVALAQIEVFCELARETHRVLAAHLTPHTLDVGQDVYTEGEPAESLFVLTKGAVKTMRRLDCGAEVEVAHHRAPALFGDFVEVLVGGPRWTCAQVLEPATVAAITREELLHLLGTEPGAATKALLMLSQRYRHAEERRMQLVHDWQRRTAGQLLDPLRLAARHKPVPLITSSLGSGKSTTLAAWAGSYASHTPVRRCMLVFVIEGFTEPDRSTRLALRTALHDLLGHSLLSVGISWTHLETADFGDGALVLLDPEASKTRPLHPLVSELARSLAQYNSTPPSTERLRLRVAVHAGEVQRTEDGFVGEDLDVAFRLLSARPRRRLARRSADLALILSDQVYQRAVAHPDPETSIAGYEAVRVKAGQDTVMAWVRVSKEGEIIQGPDTGASSSSQGTSGSSGTFGDDQPAPCDYEHC
jgi:CRP-like cAMP-binding protein